MTNFEKYKDEILEIMKTYGRPARVKGKFCGCHGTDCDECEFLKYGDRGCVGNFLLWLYEEYKESAPKLTMRERAFCESLAVPTANRVERSSTGNLYLVTEYQYALSLDNSWFPFIKCNEYYGISRLLKLEVEND